MYKKLFIPAIFIIAIFSALVINNNIFSNTQSNPAPTFQVTVYQTGGSTIQANAEVIVENSNGNTVKSGTTNSSGIVSWSWDQPYGNYTVKAWYPTRPLDGQSAQNTVNYSGSSIYTSVTLGPNY
ncbi:MAG: hypothetical protein WAT71_00660 [Ignavibacteria bacterium]